MLKWTSQGSLASPRHSVASSPGRKPVMDTGRLSMASERSVSCRGSVSSLGSQNFSPQGGSDVNSMPGASRDRQHTERQITADRPSRGKVRANARRASCSLPGSPQAYAGLRSEGHSQKKNVLTKVMKIFRKHKDHKEKASGSTSQPTSPRRSLSFLSPEAARKKRGNEVRKKSTNTRLGRLIEAKRRERKPRQPDQALHAGSTVQHGIHLVSGDKDTARRKPKNSNIMEKFLDSPPILSTFKGTSSSQNTAMPFETDENTPEYHLAKQDLFKPRVKYSHHPHTLLKNGKRSDGTPKSYSMRETNSTGSVPRMTQVLDDSCWTGYRERSPLIRTDTEVLPSEICLEREVKRRTGPEMDSGGDTDILSPEKTYSPSNLSKIRGVKVFHASPHELILARSALSPVIREPSPFSTTHSPSNVPGERQDKGEPPLSPDTIKASDVKTSSQADISSRPADLAKTETKNNNNGHHHKKATTFDEKPLDIFGEGCKDERIDTFSSFEKDAQREYSKRDSIPIVQDDVFDTDVKDNIVSVDTDRLGEVFRADIVASPPRHRVRDIVNSLGRRMLSQNIESSSRRFLCSSNRFSDALNVSIDTLEEDSCGPSSPPSFTMTEGFNSYSVQDNKGSESVSKEQHSAVGDSTGFSPNFSESKDWRPCDVPLTGGAAAGRVDESEETTVGLLEAGGERVAEDVKQHMHSLLEPSPGKTVDLSEQSAVCSKEETMESRQDTHLGHSEVIFQENLPTLTRGEDSLLLAISKPAPEVDTVRLQNNTSFTSNYEGLHVNHDRMSKGDKSTLQEIDSSPDLSISVCPQTDYGTKTNSHHFESIIQDSEKESILVSGFPPSTGNDKTLPEFMNNSPTSNEVVSELGLSENEPQARTFCKGESRADTDVFVMPDCALEVNRDLNDLPLTPRMKKRVSFKLDQPSDADSTHSEDKALLDAAPSCVSAQPRAHVSQGEELCDVSVLQVRGDASSTDVSSSLFTDDEVPEPYGTGNVTSTSAEDLSWGGGEASEDPMLFCDEKLASTVAQVHGTPTAVCSIIEIVAEQNSEGQFQSSPHAVKITKALEQGMGNFYSNSGKDRLNTENTFYPGSELTSVEGSKEKRHKIIPSRSGTEIAAHQTREMETLTFHRGRTPVSWHTPDSSPEASMTHDGFNPGRTSEQGKVTRPTVSSSMAWWDKEAAQGMEVVPSPEGNEEEPIQPKPESSIAWWDKGKVLHSSELDVTCSDAQTSVPHEDNTVFPCATSNQTVMPRNYQIDRKNSGPYSFEYKKEVVLTDRSPKREKPEEYHDAVESAVNGQGLDREKSKFIKTQDAPTLQGMPTVYHIPGDNIPTSGNNPSISPMQKRGEEKIKVKSEDKNNGTAATERFYPEPPDSDAIPARLAKCVAEADMHCNCVRDKSRDSDTSDVSDTNDVTKSTIGNDTTYPINENMTGLNNQTLSRWPKRTRILTQTSPFDTSLKGVCILSDNMSCDGSGDCYDSSEDGCAYRDLLCNFNSKTFSAIPPQSEGTARDGIQCWPVRDSGKANPSWESPSDEAIGKQASPSFSHHGFRVRTPEHVVTRHRRQRSSSSDHSDVAAVGRRRGRSGDTGGATEKERSAGAGKKRRSHYTNTGQRPNSGRKQHLWNDQFPPQHSPQPSYDRGYQQQQRQYYRETRNRRFTNQQSRFKADNSDLHQARGLRRPEASNGEDDEEMSNDWLYFAESGGAQRETVPRERSRKSSRGQETVEWLFLATFFVFQLLLHWIYAK